MEMMSQAETGSGPHRPQDAFVPDRPDRRMQNRALMVRVAHVGVAAGLIVALLLSFWLKPDPRGVGTHEQLLVWPCNFHVLTGLPCPFCGMTTAFAFMARGQVREVLLAQPVGALGFVVCVLMLPVSIGAALSGKDVLGALARLPWDRLSWAIVAMLAIAWIFKLALTLAH